MLRNRRLARSIADGGFYKLRRQIDYKARLYGARVIVADRWYPSSKTCFCCGVIKETLALAERTFRCDDCSFEIARDINAARNLARLAASSAVSACGVERAVPDSQEPGETVPKAGRKPCALRGRLMCALRNHQSFQNGTELRILAYN